MGKKESGTSETVKQNSKIAELTDIGRKELIARAKKLSKKFRVTSQKKFKLKDYPTFGFRLR
jgi:hypothetical protein